MEMMGLFGGLLGAGASVAGGIMNAEAQDETNQLNWAINVMNMQERRRERDEAIAMALKQRREQQLGTTDIRGTRTHFVPGKGWIVEGSPDVLAMQKAQDREQMLRLTHDLPMRRKQMDLNYQQTFPERALADTFMRKLQNRYVPDDSVYEGQLYDVAAEGLREARRDAGRRLFTNVGRTGGNIRAYQETADAISRSANDAYAKARLNAKLAARGSGVAIADARDKNNANLYNLFATRASQLPDTQYKPENIDTQGTLTASQAGMLNTGALATNMFAKKGGELDYTTANMGYGNAIASGGAALASAFRGMGAQRQYGGGVSGFGGSGDGDSELYTGGEGTFYSA